MGDEVKITVIATGFKQQENQPGEAMARRERMLGGTAMPVIQFDPPISRVAAARAQFEGAKAAALPVEPVPVVEEIEDEPLKLEPVEAVVDGREVAEDDEVVQELVGSGHADEPEPVIVAAAQSPELIPVPRSVFDDEFFKVSARELLAQPTVAESRMPSARGFDSPDSSRPLRLTYDDSAHGSEAVVADPVVRVAAFSGAVANETAEADELDIPAFLRRGQ
jgi:cell division protein FtsZ